jgi:hypothetical protein
MKTYTVLYAEDVPHYGTRTFDAATDELAVERAIGITPDAMSTFTLADDPDYNNPQMRRIVHIEGPDGTIAEGIYLDNHDLPSVLATELLQALEALIDKSDGLHTAIEGTTDQFEKEVAELSAATTAAEAIVKRARGQA